MVIKAIPQAPGREMCQFKVGMGIHKAGQDGTTGKLGSWLTITGDQVTGSANLKNPAIANCQSAACNRRVPRIVEPGSGIDDNIRYQNFSTPCGTSCSRTFT